MKGECLGAWWVVVLGIHSIPCLADTVDVKSSLGLLASKLLARQGRPKPDTEHHPPAAVTSSRQTSVATTMLRPDAESTCNPTALWIDGAVSWTW